MSAASLSDHKYWIPREYLHVDHLPLTETGKPSAHLSLKGFSEERFLAELSFSEEIECFLDFFCRSRLVDADISYASQHGEVDDAILVLLVMMHQLDELIIVIAGDIQRTSSTP